MHQNELRLLLCHLTDTKQKSDNEKLDADNFMPSQADFIKSWLRFHAYVSAMQLSYKFLFFFLNSPCRASMIGWVGFGLQIWGWVLKKMTCAQLRLRTWYITALWNGSGPNFTKIHIPLPGMPSRCRGLMITNAKTGTGSGNARGKRTDGRKCMPDYCFQRTPPPPPRPAR